MQQPDEFERGLMSRITWRVMPFLCICYMAAFLDRVNLAFAKDQMAADLGLSNAAYGFGAGLFFIGYFLFEVPSNLILARIGARVWIARIMILWGIISACMMFVVGPRSFYVLRFLLGASEAGFFPGMILYLTFWFPSAYRSRAVALFMTACVAAEIFGSPLSGLLLQLDGTLGLRGWKWLFLIEGLPSIVLGVLVFRRLPNGPREATWLKPDELGWLESRIASERARAHADDRMTLSQALTDPRVLLLAVVYTANVLGGYGLEFFMPTLIAQAFPAAQPWTVGLLNSIPSVFAVVAMILYGRSSDRSGDRKWHVAIALAVAAAGLALASLQVPAGVAMIAVTLVVCGRWCMIAPFWGLSTAFLSGRAAAGAIAFINAVGNLGGFGGPSLMGALKDRTGTYALGMQVLAAIMLLGGVLTLKIRVARHAPPVSTPAPAS